MLVRSVSHVHVLARYFSHIDRLRVLRVTVRRSIFLTLTSFVYHVLYDVSLAYHVLAQYISYIDLFRVSRAVRCRSRVSRISTVYLSH